MRITPVNAVSSYINPESISYSSKHKKVKVLTDEYKSTRERFMDEYSVNLGNIHYLES